SRIASRSTTTFRASCSKISSSPRKGISTGSKPNSASSTASDCRTICSRRWIPDSGPPRPAFRGAPGRACYHRAPRFVLPFHLPVSQAVFALLRRLHAGGLHPREELVRALGVSQGELDDCIAALRAQGVAIESTPAGCALRRRVDLLDATALSERLHERDTDLRVTLYDECDSTNARLLAEPEVHARVICCELQTAGRGRRGRVWRSGLGDALTFSLGWRIDRPVHALGGLSLAAAVTCAGTLEALGIGDVQV